METKCGAVPEHGFIENLEEVYPNQNNENNTVGLATDALAVFFGEGNPNGVDGVEAGGFGQFLAFIVEGRWFGSHGGLNSSTRRPDDRLMENSSQQDDLKTLYIESAYAPPRIVLDSRHGVEASWHPVWAIQRMQSELNRLLNRPMTLPVDLFFGNLYILHPTDPQSPEKSPALLAEFAVGTLAIAPPRLRTVCPHAWRGLTMHAKLFPAFTTSLFIGSWTVIDDKSEVSDDIGQ